MESAYSNRDFYLSAFLLASGYKLSKHERRGGITTFHFEVDEKLEKLIEQFYSMNTVIEPILYGNALKNLKSIIHANTNTEKLTNVKQYKESCRV